jgi:hypothetical protein
MEPEYEDFNDVDFTDQELIEMDGQTDVPEESPEGGLVLQVLDHRGAVEDIIIGLENIRTYISKLETQE